MKFEISGIVTASMQPDIPPVSTKRVPTPPALRGVVLSSQTGYPVARVKVAVVGSTLGSTATIPLGSELAGNRGSLMPLLCFCPTSAPISAPLASSGPA
jgi:hypothetical protein